MLAAFLIAVAARAPAVFHALLRSAWLVVGAGLAYASVLGGVLAAEGLAMPILPAAEFSGLGIADVVLLPLQLAVVWLAGELVQGEGRRFGPLPVPDAAAAGAALLCGVALAMWASAVLGAVLDPFSTGGRPTPDLVAYGAVLWFAWGWELVLLAAMSVVVYVITPRRWHGTSALLLVLAWCASAEGLGFEHVLYRPMLPEAPYSRMNGFGHLLAPVVSLGAYWSAFASFLVLVAHRVSCARTSAGRRPPARAVRDATLVTGVAWTALGAWIFYNTNVLNAHEMRVGSYVGLAGPQVLSLDLAVDLFPARRAFRSGGSILLGNMGTSRIAHWTLAVPHGVRVEALEVPAVLVEQADALGFRRYRFEPPLRPTERVRFTFELSRADGGFRDVGAGTDLVANGTFLTGGDVMPVVGGPPLRGSRGCGPTQTAARMRFRARLSTPLDQTAVAPGRLARAWRENDRAFFEYETEAPIPPCISIQSARYALTEVPWAGTTVAVYRDPARGRTVEALMGVAGEHLDGCLRRAASCRRLRVVEVPYARTVAWFPGTLVVGE